MQIRTGKLKKEDVKAAGSYAAVGMNFGWYIRNPVILKFYSRFFYYMEANEATQIISAYEDDGTFAGVITARMEGEKPVGHSFLKSIYIKLFHIIVHYIFGLTFKAYLNVNEKMLKAYDSEESLDGEISFIVANPDLGKKGIGTLLLQELSKREPGKKVYVFTDEGCSYNFYEKRGFERKGEEKILLKTQKGEVPLDCYMYIKVLE